MAPSVIFSRTLPCIIVLNLLWSCEGRIDKTKAVVEPVSQVAVKLLAEDCAANGTLPILWTEVSDILNANGSISFRFYVDEWKDLTLHGWQRPYDMHGPVVKLKTSTLSNVEVGSGNYLGNLYLTAPMIAKIRQEVNQHHWVFIKFFPVIDQRSGSEGQVTYRYELTMTALRLKTSIPSDSLKLLMDSTMYSLTDTSLVTGSDYLNPSPPRNEQ